MLSNRVFSWLFIFALVIGAWIGAQYVRGTTVCGEDTPKTWHWDPPHWECQPGQFRPVNRIEVSAPDRVELPEAIDGETGPR